MFAIGFDLVVRETEANHPVSVAQAYADIGAVLKGYGFDRIQGSLYVTRQDDLANLFAAISALSALEWFAPSVRDIRAFRVEQWSDFTPLIKDGAIRGGLGRRG
ncbi:virulence factor [Zavarzinia sp. CC-PAN008]|uniref:virulence factor n=1 Tax=Zavarzinia sp. CC-PAN008 TaxID=3243332 RepID=UPI003F746121